MGIVAFGVINQYYYYRLRAELGAGAMHSKIAYFAPGDPGYVQDISGVAILKSSQHTGEAQELLNFMTSAAGQRIISTSDSFDTRCARGWPPTRADTAGPAAPPQLAPADLGTGVLGEQLLEQAGVRDHGCRLAHDD